MSEYYKFVTDDLSVNLPDQHNGVILGIDRSASDGYPFYITHPHSKPNLTVTDDSHLFPHRFGISGISQQGIGLLNNEHVLLGSV